MYATDSPKKSHYAEARIVTLEEPSPLRISPRCKHFTTCGGCKWQHIPYEEQLTAKATQVRDAMERLGKVEVGEYLPILGSQEIYQYRNKLEFTFSNRRWRTSEELASLPEGLGEADNSGLGFHIPGKFDKVLDIEECYLGNELSNRIRNFFEPIVWSALSVILFTILGHKRGNAYPYDSHDQQRAYDGFGCICPRKCAR